MNDIRKAWEDHTPTELLELKAKGFGAAGMEIERRLKERDRYKAALEAIVATDVPRIDEGDWMTEIAQEALDA